MAVASIVFFASTAAAQDQAHGEPKRLSLTVSPLHALMPIAEVSGELGLGKWLGLGLTIGYGSVATKLGTEETRFRAIEAGGRVNVYPWANRGVFEGPQIGIETMYLDLDTDRSVQLMGAAHGLTVGHTAGYKVITRSGFTLEVNGGIQVLAVGKDGRPPAKGLIWLPLLNLHVGWSF